MTSQTSMLEKYEPYSGKGSIIFGNGEYLNIFQIGTSKLTDDVNLLDVLVMPHKNLLSINKLTSDYPVDVFFFYTCFTIQNQTTNIILAQGRCDSGLYVIDRRIPALVIVIRTRGLLDVDNNEPYKETTR